MRTKTIDVSVSKSTDNKDVYTFLASNEAVDRDGDVIKVEGWDVSRFQKNPVILFAHDQSQMPVGKATAVRKITDGDRRLEMDIEFAQTDFAQDIKSLVEGGFLNAVSVGFKILDADMPSEEVRGALGMPPYGFLISKAELLETSIVPVPANQDALRRAVDEGVVCQKSADLIASSIKDTSAMSTSLMLDEMRELIVEQKALLAELKEQLSVKDGTVGDPAMPKESPSTESQVYGDLLDKAYQVICNPTVNEES